MSSGSTTAASAVSAGDWFVTRAELKTHLSLTGSSEDTKLDEIIADVSAMIRSYTGRHLTQRTYTDELYDGGGTDRLYLREYPVTAVSDVRVALTSFGGAGNDDAFSADNLWTQNESYIVTSLTANERNVGELVAIRGTGWPESKHGAWPHGKANIRVGSYTAGYSNLPGDLKLACLQICARVRASAEQGIPMQSESLGDYSYQVMLVERELSHARKILNAYKAVL